MQKSQQGTWQGLVKVVWINVFLQLQMGFSGAPFSSEAPRED